ncbi:alpha-amylase family glycosyl hydrolase [Pedobacter punctiformis]|uniref:Alpha-amylase family glycosyl hydrolase n=1 Tax=Pedobacter punctiformis TaxID=3004097 RepID=A0ABT4L404_9SPHI|nr:alpha-amylase family glycosyl hydrolase [Pedobacter sp. HCMS5-2]MCZ4242648.1 alpha-amylase family glycosyl hydrolase [Pedobacter sp. HCMS5-2]
MKKMIYFLLFITVLNSACKKVKTDDPITDPVSPSTELPAGAKDGVAFINNGTSAIVTLYAPGKTSVSLIGEFNNWSSSAGIMKKTSDGNYWWIQVDNLNPATEYAYQFLVNETLKVADPYCEKILDADNDKYIAVATYPNLKAYPTGKTSGIVSVMQANQPVYTWKNTSFTRPDKSNLVIYELLVRDFTSDHNYASTLAKLDYLSNLGINAIELMPVNEFEGNLSWGYNPSFYFAPDKYYGTKTALQNFIDECHGRGIAVIMDMVLNHSFGQSPMVQLYFDGKKPTSDSPWFNIDAKHPYNVGYDFNHESAATKYFAKNVMKFWMQQYKIDGFRFDLSKGFTQKVSADDASFAAYDAGRVAIWKEYNNYIKSIDPNNFYVILEHFADATEEKVLADEGMMLWNNMNYNMNEATMGWLGNSDFSWGFYAKHGFSKSDHLVGYIESHDEERLNFKNITYGNASGNYVIKANLPTSLKRQEMAATFMLSIPGPKMIWQFGELGYDISIDFNGRTGEKPIKWDYFTDVNRKALYDVYSKLIKLKKNNTIFNSTSSTYNLTGGIKYIKLTEAANTVFVVGNFDVVPQPANIDFGASGNWIDAFGSNVNLTSSTYTATLAPGEYHIFSKVALK